jgi:hypothetical protein
MVNGSPNPVYVLDAANNYNVVGQFNISGFGDFTGAGLEFACDGTLWAVNQVSNTVYQVESGEEGQFSACFTDVPWISENPSTGTVPADGGQIVVDVTYDAGQVPQPGDYFAHLQVTGNKPAQNPNVDITMHVPVPPNFGLLEGTVDGTGRCDGAGGPIADATVFVHGPNADYTLTTDDSGHYQWYFDAGNSPVDITVSAPGYLGQTVTGVVMTAGGTTTQDFTLRLDAPCGSAAPPSFDVTLGANEQSTLPLTLMNAGGGALDFTIFESGGFNESFGKGKIILNGSHKNISVKIEKPKVHKNVDASTTAFNARGIKRLPQPKAAPTAQGDIIQTWPSGLVFSWGIAFDGFDGTVWVDSPSAGWGGDNNLYEFDTAGTQTGRLWPHTWGPGSGPADTAYNWNTGMFWLMDVAGDDCIHEVDPASGVTGNTICPGFPISQRGLAYDPSTDTYLAAGWNDFTVYRFDTSGNILETVNVGLAVSGLAYNPDTQHLFAMVNDSPNPVFVLDAANNYSVVGQFTISGFGDFSGAGLEFGCDGSLWAVNQVSNTVYQVESGEPFNVKLN